MIFLLLLFYKLQWPFSINLLDTLGFSPFLSLSPHLSLASTFFLDPLSNPPILLLQESCPSPPSKILKFKELNFAMNLLPNAYKIEICAFVMSLSLWWSACWSVAWQSCIKILFSVVCSIAMASLLKHAFDPPPILPLNSPLLLSWN